MEASLKIAITGARGQVGSDCVEVLAGGHRYKLLPLGSDDLDITDARSVRRILDGEKPDIIVNCGAFTNVDACEEKKEESWAVNVTGVKNLAETARESGAWLIHISSDYVFDGERPLPQSYVEDDRPSPVSHYGVTKWEGEKAINASGARATILRTAWVYGANGANFLKTILRLSLTTEGKPLKVVDDQMGSLTWSYRLARQIEKIIEHQAMGLFHASAEGHCTWYEAAREFLALMKVDKAVRPCLTTEFPRPAPRPKNSILENRNLKKAGLNVMVDWREDLQLFVGKFRERLMDEVTGR